MPHPAASLQVQYSHQVIATVIGVVGLLLALMFAAARLRRRDPYVLLLLGGGLLSAALEPFLDVLGLCWHPLRHQFVGNVYSLLDRPIPLFVPLVYTWYFGLGAWLVWRRLESGDHDLLRLWAYIAVFEAVLETVGTGVLKSYFYYGEQPLNVWGVPLWWPMMNAVPLVASGVALYVIAPQLTGIRRIAIVAVVPMASAAAYVAVGLTTFAALNTRASMLVTTIAALVEIVCIWLTIAFLGIVVRSRSALVATPV